MTLNDPDPVAFMPVRKLLPLKFKHSDLLMANKIRQSDSMAPP